MKKRVLALILIVSMACSFSGCMYNKGWDDLSPSEQESAVKALDDVQDILNKIQKWKNLSSDEQEDLKQAIDTLQNRLDESDKDLSSSEQEAIQKAIDDFQKVLDKN